MASSNRNASGGTSSLTVLLIVFVVLKLTDNIDWSWFWVLSPMTIPLGLIAGGVALYFGIRFVLWLPKTLWQLVTRTRPKSNLDAAYAKMQDDEKGPMN